MLLLLTLLCADGGVSVMTLPLCFCSIDCFRPKVTVSPPLSHKEVPQRNKLSKNKVLCHSLLLLLLLTVVIGQSCPYS